VFYEVVFFCCHLISFTETRVINMDLRYPFLSFSLDKVLLLIGCILTQQRIVFLSSSYSLLTPVIEVCTLSNLWKQSTFCDATAGSPRNDVWKTTCHYPDLGRASDWLKQISRGNHRWRRKTSAVFLSQAVHWVTVQLNCVCIVWSCSVQESSCFHYFIDRLHYGFIWKRQLTKAFSICLVSCCLVQSIASEQPLHLGLLSPKSVREVWISR